MRPELPRLPITTGIPLSAAATRGGRCQPWALPVAKAGWPCIFSHPACLKRRKNAPGLGILSRMSAGFHGRPLLPYGMTRNQRYLGGQPVGIQEEAEKEKCYDRPPGGAVHGRVRFCSRHRFRDPASCHIYKAAHRGRGRCGTPCGQMARRAGTQWLFRIDRESCSVAGVATD